MELFILRHGKSSWSIIKPDFTRVLAKRGIKATQQIAQYAKKNHIKPELILTSPATRAVETLNIFLEKQKENRPIIRYEPSMYLASLDDLLNIIDTITTSEIPIKSAMLVGHNPGLEQLVAYLAQVKLSKQDKYFPTAAFAHFSIYTKQPPILKCLLRPKEM